ncbi:hypothetical protein [Pseudomonas sp. NFACC37-1]|uniref:hypothetical protein n=1 Tax=Pseudomonas sp. NFACC37-1 TaxID=1566196 RepID=UPI00087E9AC9|nr:hypothetical protein [Pseudomonas sp. NFACC37-1]SCZ13195.1 hypothetical protein SAMN03159391_05792 [Pseudomonas sp. NFACC37-1]
MSIRTEGTHLFQSTGNEFSSLGARLVRFGQALQDPSTTVSELVRLAQACGITFKLRVVAESEGRDDE